MNILRPTQEDIKNQLKWHFCDGNKMLEDCLNNAPTKDGIIKSVANLYDNIVKDTRAKDIKEYHRDCKKVIISYLETGELKGIEDLEPVKKEKPKKEKVSMDNVKLVIKAMHEQVKE